MILWVSEMNYQQLETFLSVASSGNFNRSAENLCVTQSAVSTRIRSLEESLGVELFSRGRFGAELTSSGMQFQQYAVQICEIWKQAQKELALPRGYDGMLRLATQFSVWETLVNSWVIDMRQRYPSIALHIEADYSMAMMQHIADNLLDIAVMYQPRIMLDIEIVKLFDEEFVLISTEPCSLDNLDRQKYVYIGWCPGFQAAHHQLVPFLSAQGVTMGLGSMAIEYLRARQGSMYLQSWRAQSLIDSGEFHRVEGAPSILQPVSAVYRKDAEKNQLYDDAIKSLKQCAHQAQSGGFGLAGS